MTWQTAMWANFRNMYWNVRYIGLKRVKARAQSDGYFVSTSELLPKGNLYTRLSKESQWVENMLSQEEVLNHFVNVFASICPSDVLAGLFVDPFHFDIAGAKFLHLDVAPEIEPKLFDKVQPDMILTAPQTAVMVELKTGSDTTVAQLGKYFFALAHFDLAFGLKNAGLLYICNEKQAASLRKFVQEHCGDGGKMSGELSAAVSKICNKYKVTDDLRARVIKMAEVTKIRFRSWTSLFKSLSVAHMVLPDKGLGNQALRNLIEGLLAQLSVHKRIGLNAGAGSDEKIPYFDHVTPTEPFRIPQWTAEKRSEFRAELEKVTDDRIEEIFRIALSEWCGPSVMRTCCHAPIDDLRLFAKGLRSGGPIPLGFRWASDGDSGGPIFERVSN